MVKRRTKITANVIAAAERLRDRVEKLKFESPVAYVYNPLQYAWQSHRDYLLKANPKKGTVFFLGMNPGPWGMAQTGVPFGEIAAVRDWLQIETVVNRPENEHPKRPVEGFECEKSEVSGRRLWGLFQEKFASPDDFFQHHFIGNYCPLVFMEASARNRTPDKLAASERESLHAVCDEHLMELLSILQPKHVVGVGAYAEKCLQRALDAGACEAKLSRILHPSPASPAANRDWAGTATRQLQEAGIW
ncbi:Uracil DNA glycosylase superfamily protein [Novipirellula aureliae]|uniref:Uracil DNA glycosylase superfamily protein n=1 Tax=Novipirellula aureliae TaxID=2527966 RepID=A0A5C6EDJ6_9BACT|nr:uracil-DNA glycosylase family protein [Novipirellula aureliae]TWU45299.1 Uracil DNA glycosylase superfamily protein [Novipirellula aureliae]